MGWREAKGKITGDICNTVQNKKERKNNALEQEESIGDWTLRWESAILLGLVALELNLFPFVPVPASQVLLSLQQEAKPPFEGQGRQGGGGVFGYITTAPFLTFLNLYKHFIS